jgi:hypothetical protein
MTNVPTAAVDLLALGVGIIVTWILGLFVRPWALDAVTINPPETGGGSWRQKDVSGGPQLGFLERLLFFISAWASGAYVLGGAWLAFKVASKWYGWQHIVKVPDKPDTLTLDDRHRLGSWITSRFLLGTLYNMLAGISGAGVARWLDIHLR